MITYSELRHVLKYDPASGEFNWLVPIGRHGRIRAGSCAGSVNPDTGYLLIQLRGKKYPAHRLAWLYSTGSWPENEIDHRNGDKLDNRLSNLRDATHAQNMQNRQRARSDSKSGVLGVYWHERDRQWRAEIMLNGKTRRLGVFNNLADATAARVCAEKSMFSHAHRLHGI